MTVAVQLNNQGADFRNRPELIIRVVRFFAPGVGQIYDKVLGINLGKIFELRFIGKKTIRISFGITGRQADQVAIHAFSNDQPCRFFCCLYACLVGITDYGDTVAKFFDLLDLIPRQGGSGASHSLMDSDLVQPDHVGIPFNKVSRSLFLYGIVCPV